MAMTWEEYKKWSKECNEYLKKGKPLLRQENVVDMDYGIIKDSKGNEYQATFNKDGTFSGIKKVKEG